MVIAMVLSEVCRILIANYHIFNILEEKYIF